MTEPSGTSMQAWHLTGDAPRTPLRVAPGEPVDITIGTWPIGPGQLVVVEADVVDGASGRWERTRARWVANRDGNSYWTAQLGPFQRGDRVRYQITVGDGDGERSLPACELVVGPRAHVAIVWHQHQPMYRRLSATEARGSMAQPWVRLHTLRDYVAMPMLAAEAPGVRVTFNLSPSLLAQVEAYLAGATDRHLELTLVPAATLSGSDRAEIIDTFFDADWQHQIEPHPRYRALFEARRDGAALGAADLVDLQMWSNLCWFADEYRTGDVLLPTGETVSVRRFVDRGAGFDDSDIRAMVDEQYKLLRAVIPAHRALASAGRFELTTSPYFHPILPLLVDSDAASIDLAGATRPPRFAHPDDAEAQVAAALRAHAAWFGAAPRGLWPPEGAVSAALIPMLARRGVQWIASDEGVLARSGRWGYDVTRPEVLYTAYRAERDGRHVTVLFRDRRLSDAIGFALQRVPDPEAAAEVWMSMLRSRVHTLPADARPIVTVVLDGENAWGGYPRDGRPFLRALYRRLAAATDIETTTPSAWLDDHPAASLPAVFDLFPGSWIDEPGSGAGVDHGTWIGEVDENEAWAQLGRARAWLDGRDVPAALTALHAAEGSDWFWWLGNDHDSAQDTSFAALFRAHLADAYLLAGGVPPPELATPSGGRTVVWELTSPRPHIRVGDRLLVRTHCSGLLSWWTERDPPVDVPLVASGGAMSGPRRRHAIVGPFAAPGTVSLRVRCDHPHNGHLCCNRGIAELTVAG